MSINQSYLSSPKYGYDFVVATTQASINSGLKEYLHNIDQPETIICYLADSLGNPSVQISLADLLKRTGGINPFDIPNGTPYTDNRLKVLTEQKFIVGLKIKLGLPPGLMPKDMPPIVDLGDSANNVLFNLLCSEFQVIQNSPPGGFSQGSWNVWSQPSGTSWYFTTKVNLMYSALSQELDTPYFNSHPKQKQALLDQLYNLSSGAFSLQQLLFDLDNAATMSIPKIAGMDPGSDAALILTKSFVNLYFQSVKEHGEPVLSVHAVANAPDGSTLRLTAMEREVAPLLDGNGVVIPHPNALQKEVTTLCYLCAANNNPLPGTASFNWNWVVPAEVNNESGVIAINRNTLANYYKTKLVPQIRQSCIKPWTSITAHMMGSLDTKWSLTPGQTPQRAEVTESGADVLVISYSCNADSHDKSGLTYGEFDLHSSYTCTVSFSGNTITIVQHLVMYIKVTFDYTSASGNIVDKTITDPFTLSIGQNGAIQLTAGTPTMVDNSKDPDFGWFMHLISNFQDLVDDAKKSADKVVNVVFTDIPGENINNFVFPGAKVFTYKDVSFSDKQDMVSKVTYVTPT